MRSALGRQRSPQERIERDKAVGHFGRLLYCNLLAVCFPVDAAELFKAFGWNLVAGWRLHAGIVLRRDPNKSPPNMPN